MHPQQRELNRIHPVLCNEVFTALAFLHHTPTEFSPNVSPLPAFPLPLFTHSLLRSWAKPSIWLHLPSPVLTHNSLLWRGGGSQGHPTGTDRILHASEPLLSHIYMACSTGSTLWHRDVTLGDENKGWRIHHPHTPCREMENHKS